MNEQAPTPDTASALSRPRVGGRRDLFLAAVATVLCGALAAEVAEPGIRATAGVILELLLPGYAAAALATHRRALDAAELLLCALGGSLVVGVLGSLLIDVIPGHTARLGWAILLVLVTLLMLGAAAHRPPSEPAVAERESAQDDRTARDPFYLRLVRALDAASRTIINAALGTVALVIVIGAIAIAGHAANRSPGFTELSALPRSVRGGTTMVIAVSSHEHRTVSFVVTVRENGRVRNKVPIELRPHQTWHSSTALLRRGARRVRVDVRRAGSTRPYLHTVYYLPGPRALGTGRTRG